MLKELFQAIAGELTGKILDAHGRAYTRFDSIGAYLQNTVSDGWDIIA